MSLFRTAALALTASCLLTTVADAATLRWVGCGISKKAFMSAMAEAYQEKTGTLIELEGGGATRGIRDVAKGAADIGGSCRHKILVDEESKSKLIPVGWDAVVAITHPSNPVKELSKDQLKGIMIGEIANWNEVGGPDAPIKLVIRRGKISGVGLMARELLFTNPNQDFSADAHVVKSTGPAESYVEGEPFALALTGISSGRKRKVNFVNLDGADPSYENISSGRYPLFRPLYVVVPTKPSDEVRKFVAFATGPEGQEILKSQGTVTMRDGSRLWPAYRKNMQEARKQGGF